MYEYIIGSGVAISLFLLSGIRIIRPTHRGLIERFGKYKRIQNPGITWIMPFIERNYKINITERLADISTQEIITQDNLNAMVDLQVYYKIKEDESSLKKSVYNVFNYQLQIIALARTTMRNVIGNKVFADVNSKRNVLNDMLRITMQKEVQTWGIDIVRCELKEIRPPNNVQEAMNNVLVAQNRKTAAIDFATATETEADGMKRAEIKKAEGIKQAKILQAEGEAEAIKLVNTSADIYFIGNAQKLKALEVTQNSLINNTKYIITEEGVTPTIVLGEGIIPINKKS